MYEYEYFLHINAGPNKSDCIYWQTKQRKSREGMSGLEVRKKCAEQIRRESFRWDVSGGSFWGDKENCFLHTTTDKLITHKKNTKSHDLVSKIVTVAFISLSPPPSNRPCPFDLQREQWGKLYNSHRSGLGSRH